MIELPTAMNRRSKIRHGLGRDALHAGAILEKDGAAAALGLIAAQQLEQLGAGLLGPFGIGLHQAAGGDGSDLDDRTHHDQVIIALRRRELDIGIVGGSGRSRRAPKTPPKREEAMPCPCAGPSTSPSGLSIGHGKDKELSYLVHSGLRLPGSRPRFAFKARFALAQGSAAPLRSEAGDRDTVRAARS